ncbi:hypothetical protein N2382_00635 [SAR92 clade bacterium H921]|jgi:Tfp pilus assembly protein FimV|nr:hypothetical protein [SAR92 clade bacterium H921]
MKIIKNFLKNTMIFMRKLFLISIISIVVSALAAVISASMVQAEVMSSQKALAQLLKDVKLLKPALAERAQMTGDGYYMIRHGDTLDGIIARVLPDLPLRKKILRDAVVQANPHAFKRKNPNWMYANKKIKLPDTNDIHNVIFTGKNNLKSALKSDEQARKSWVHYP